jgi:beta-glucosidase
VAVVVLGLSPRIEGEEGDSEGDRINIDLPGVQEELLQAVYATGTPIVLVLLSGSALAVNWAEVSIPAIVAAWYPGEEGGTALADVLFGDYNPAGRLPVTFYKSVEQLPSFSDYRMAGRTYRFFTGEPLYPFGFGLSYTSFSIDNLMISPAQVKGGEVVNVTAEVSNTGKVAGDEVVQLYIHQKSGSDSRPVRELKGFERVTLQPGEAKTVSFQLGPDELGYWSTNAGKWIQEAAEFDLWVGDSSLETLHAELTVIK